VRDTLEAQGYETILVDDGDAIQGEPIGTLSEGEAVIDLMNDLKYDVAIPGNHEFDYGMPRFLELVKKAEFPYISCNFTYMDELVFEPYLIKEAAGKKIGFVGVTTPLSITSSTPVYFQDENGEYVYGFMSDDTGERLYQAVQSAVDAARAEGADYVYVIGHMGNGAQYRPWTYADVISHTNGIDAFLDGHSHDTDQVVMKNKDGEDVPRSAVGTKMECIGYSHISAEGEIVETGIWSWPNRISAPELLNIHNEIRDRVNEAQQELAEQLNEVVASTAVTLTVNDPKEVDRSGKPVRMIRRAETNLGDLCADAARDQSGADIAFVNGGSIRVSIEKGDITFGNILAVHPFGSMLCVLEVTGQQILDALEWSCHSVPDENGGFNQVSGLTFEINSAIDSPCKADKDGMCVGIEGERRVQNVMVGGEALDPEKTYTLAGYDYQLRQQGDGYTAYDGAPVLQDNVKLDNQVLIDYIVDTLGGEVGGDYADPYGQGRITVLE
jgi:2',3'-cyclic-nucleotide 2'-phosphodiesterase (5'-nucleotidase family)